GPAKPDQPDAAPGMDWLPLMSETAAPRPNYRLFSPGKAALAGFLGGPFAGGIVAAISLWRLGQRQRGLLALILGTGLLALWVGACVVWNEAADRVPNILVWGVGMAFSYLVAHVAYSKAYAAFIEQRGTPSSGLAAAGLGLALGVVQAAVIIAAGR